MSKQDKKTIIIALVVLVIGIVIAVIFVNGRKNDEVVGAIQNDRPNEMEYAVELSDGTKINTSDALKNVKKYKDLEISNIQYTEQDGNTVLLADVKNTGSTEHATEMVEITILDGDNKEITKISGVIGKIAPNATIKLNASVTADVVNAKDIKIEAKK